MPGDERSQAAQMTVGPGETEGGPDNRHRGATRLERAPQDVLNYPIRLNNRLASLAGVVSAGDYKATDQEVEVAGELTKQIDDKLAKLRRVLEEDLASFNELLAKKKVPGVFGEVAKGKG